MRIEKCVENASGKITVSVDDDTIRATDNEAVNELLQVLDAAMEGVKGDVGGQIGLDEDIGIKTATVWCPITEALPEEGERVLVATPSTVMVATLAGMTKDEPSRPRFTSAESFAEDAFCGIKYWSRLPSVPQPVIDLEGESNEPT